MRHLSKQVIKNDLEWEVIVVDNGSSDDTAAYAKKLWPASLSDRFRVVIESKPGLAYARQRGFNEAKNEIVSFIDDDNWVCPEWSNLVSALMERMPDVGALGGFCEGVFEEKPPEWFEQFSRSYAVGVLAPEASDVTWSRGYLFGAGMSIRKCAWEAICRKGFIPLLTDRKGAGLSSGGDGEICKALRLAGWKLYYDPQLHLRHFIPAARLNWNYLRQLRRGMGSASIFADCYSFASSPNRFGFSKLIKEDWMFQMMTTLLELAACGRMAVSSSLRNREGNARALQAESQLGRLDALWQARLGYNRIVHRIRNAPWRAASTAGFPPSKKQYAIAGK